MTERAAQTLGHATLAAASLTLSLLAAEGLTRAFTAVSPPLEVTDASVGRTYRPSYSATVYVEECDCDVPLRFNREGFRGPDRSYEKPAETRRIALIGDSMVASIATAEEHTAARRMEELLASAQSDTGGSSSDSARAGQGGASWEVMNFGVAGASTAQELELYRRTVRRYQPDVVVLAFFLRNDAIDNSPMLGSSPRVFFELDEHGELRRVPRAAALDDTNTFLNHYSRFYVWQKLKLAHVRGRWGRLDRSRFVYLREPTGEVARAWELTGAILRAFRDTVAADGPRFLVAALPAAEMLYDDVWRELWSRSGDDPAAFDPAAPERRLHALCDAAGIRFVTLTGAFRSAAADRTAPAATDLFWQGTGHFNARGNEIAAETLVQTLLASETPS